MKLKLKDKMSYLGYADYKERIDKALEESLGVITEYTRTVRLEDALGLFKLTFGDFYKRNFLITPSYSILRFAIELINKDFPRGRVEELTKLMIGDEINSFSQGLRNPYPYKGYLQLLTLWATTTAIVLWKSGKLKKPGSYKYFFYNEYTVPMWDRPKYLPGMYNDFMNYQDTELKETYDQLGLSKMAIIWLTISVAISIDWENILEEDTDEAE